MNTLLAASKALADETRLRIINILLLRELCVCELQEILDMSEPRISRHLKILKGAGLVSHRVKGKWGFYSVQERLRNKGDFAKLFDFLDEQFKKDKIFALDREKAGNTNVYCSV